jgi:hypothetical protein
MASQFYVSGLTCWLVTERLFLSREGWCPMLFMTIPTAGSHPALLNNLIQDCGLSYENIIIVSTRPGVTVPPGVVLIEDHGSPNIQRWWNRGIAEAQIRGATAVAVLNDDIRISSDTLHQLHSKLVSEGATIASPSRPPTRDRLYKRPLVPYEPRIWGCLWVLDLSSTLRPDERYVWWYGDSDLDIRARKYFRGVVNVNVDYEHLNPGVGTSQSPQLQVQSDRDAETFQQDYARMLTLSRIANRVKRAFKKC